MHASSVTFGFTKNLGNFQSAKSEVTVAISEGEDFEDAVCLASGLVKETLDMPLDGEEMEALAMDRARRGRE